MRYVEGTDLNALIAPSLVRATFKKYRRSEAITEYKELPGRSRYIAGQDGWDEVADYALRWATGQPRVGLKGCTY